jgi:dienelactone hydrolase
LTNPGTIAAFIAAILIGGAGGCGAAEPLSTATIVDFESPLASLLPLQGYLRRPDGTGPWPAVVLLHGCNGQPKRLDERWGTRIAPWGYVTLAVDSFGPRGLKNTCRGGAPVDLAFDAYRALNYLVRQPFIDAARVAVVGFSQGGWLALTSVEHGAVEATAPHKFRAAIAFYPPCLAFKGNMTVPTLILIGGADDWTPARECRNMVDGRDDWGISRQKGLGAPIKLVVYPGAYHAFDAAGLKTPIQYFGHHLEFNQAATDQSITAVRDFLETEIGDKARVE